MPPAKNKLHLSLLGGVLLVNTSVLFADDELFFDMPIVLSANRLEQPLSSAAVSITIIDRQTIEASGARTIPEVVRLVRGMHVGFSGNRWGDEPKYVVAYHGHSDQYSKQMQVLIDGRSIYEPFFGGINWKGIPINIDDIERIEISRGPNIASYGSNSFMAAINIITRTAAEDQGSYIRANAGNHDIADLTYRYGGSNGKLDYRITASTLNDDGLDSANEIDNPDDRNSNNIDYRLDYQLDNKNSISYQGGYGENDQETGRNHADVYPLERTVDNTRLFQFIKWESAINTDNISQLQYYYNYSDKEDRRTSDVVDPGGGIDPFQLDVNADIRTERHNLELTQFIQATDSLKFIWGAGAQYDSVRSELFLGTDEEFTQEHYRTFANIEYQANHRNTINLGALVEKNSLSETDLSPRISFTHAFNERHKIRFGVSQARRTPFIFESRASYSLYQDITSSLDPDFEATLRANIVGSTDYRDEELINEKILSREIVYLGEFIDSTLMFNARLFHDDLTDYIDTRNVPDDITPEPGEILYPPDGTVEIYVNEIDSSTTGLELELDYRIDPTLRLIASGAIINISSDSDKISRSAPQHSFAAMLSKRFNRKYSASIAWYYVDEFKWTDAAEINFNNSTDEYNTLDLRLSRNFYFTKANGSISVVAKNLLDDYSDYQKNQVDNSPVAINNTQAYVDFRLKF
jgi:iron complex outermembrane receptor protein